MTNDPSRGFDPTSFMSDLHSGAALNTAAIQQQFAEQEQVMREVAAEAAERRKAEQQRQAERDAHQRELVELQRKAAEREAQRDAEQAAGRDAEAKRRRNELKRWIFTTLIAVAGLTVAIIALVTR